MEAIRRSVRFWSIAAYLLTKTVVLEERVALALLQVDAFFYDERTCANTSDLALFCAASW